MITLALIVCILGLLIYLLVKPEARGGRIVEAGRIAYWTGLVFVLIIAAGKVLA